MSKLSYRKARGFRLAALMVALGAPLCLSSCLSFLPNDARAVFDGDLSAPLPLALADPGAAGRYTAKSYLYGGRRNPRRADYALGELAVVTETADLSAFFEGAKPTISDYLVRRGRYYDRVDERFWGYDQSAVPLNGKVWYPDGAGPFPLVVCIHGNHDPFEASEFGYDYLGAHLASRGIVFASVDQNFLNGSSDGRENDARAAHLLLSARELLRQSETPGSPIYRRIDPSRIGLMGHSRGGEAAATAAIFNELGVWPDDASVSFGPRLSVQGVVSLAPIEGQYRPAQKPLMFSDADYLYLQGSADGDVDSDFASRFLNRDEPDKGRFRAGFWIFGANHGFFNTTWSERLGEIPAPRANMISPAEQRDACLALVTAFFEASFGMEPRYRDFLRDWRSGRSWLPTTLYVSRWREGGDRPIADFEEDADPRSASMPGWRVDASGFEHWREGMLPLDSMAAFYDPEVSEQSIQRMNQGSAAVFLRTGKDGSSYSLSGPGIRTDGIRLDIGLHGAADPLELPDVRVLIRLTDGRSVERRLADCFRILATPETFTILKWSSRPYAPQTVDIPLERGSSISGIVIEFGPGEGREWYIDRIVAYGEGGES